MSWKIGICPAETRDLREAVNGSGLDWTGTELLNCFESTLTFPKIQRMRVGMVEVRFSHIPERFVFVEPTG